MPGQSKLAVPSWRCHLLMEHKLPKHGGAPIVSNSHLASEMSRDDFKWQRR